MVAQLHYLLLHLRRRIRIRRGLGTIVTSLLLVVAVGVIGAYLVAWSNSTFASQQATIANQTATRINLINENFVMEDVWFYNFGGKKADITIRNSGDLAITISKVYINNTQVWSGNQVIPIGSTAKITVDPLNWGSGDTQLVWVKTARGSEATQLWKAGE